MNSRLKNHENKLQNLRPWWSCLLSEFSRLKSQSCPAKFVDAGASACAKHLLRMHEHGGARRGRQSCRSSNSFRGYTCKAVTCHVIVCEAIPKACSSIATGDCSRANLTCQGFAECSDFSRQLQLVTAYSSCKTHIIFFLHKRSKHSTPKS